MILYTIWSYIRRRIQRVRSYFHNYGVWNSNEDHGVMFHAWNDKHAIRKGLRIARTQVQCGYSTFRKPCIIAGHGSPYGDGRWLTLDYRGKLDFSPA